MERSRGVVSITELQKVFNESGSARGMGALTLVDQDEQQMTSNPLCTIQVQGFDSDTKDGLILSEFSFFGANKGIQSLVGR